MPDKSRTCTKCKRHRKAKHFYKRPKTSTGLHSWCIDCCKQAVAVATKKRREDPNYRLSESLRKYGLTLEEYQAILASQRGRCYVCLRKPDDKRLVVDHNHDTGEVRGLLCHKCNAALGMLNDMAWRVRRLYHYLEVSDEQAIAQENETNLALYELLSVCDDVFTTEGAFEAEHINKSLGRCYRAWKKCRGELDPSFDPKRYPKKQRPAKERQTSTSGRKVIFATSQIANGKKGRDALR